MQLYLEQHALNGPGLSKKEYREHRVLQSWGLKSLETQPHNRAALASTGTEGPNASAGRRGHRDSPLPGLSAAGTQRWQGAERVRTAEGRCGQEEEGTQEKESWRRVNVLRWALVMPDQCSELCPAAPSLSRVCRTREFVQILRSLTLALLCSSLVAKIQPGPCCVEAGLVAGPGPRKPPSLSRKGWTVTTVHPPTC